MTKGIKIVLLVTLLIAGGLLAISFLTEGTKLLHTPYPTISSVRTHRTLGNKDRQWSTLKYQFPKNLVNLQNFHASLDYNGHFVLLTPEGILRFDGKQVELLSEQWPFIFEEVSQVFCTEDGWMWVVCQSSNETGTELTIHWYHPDRNEFKPQGEVFKRIKSEKIQYIQPLNASTVVLQSESGTSFLYQNGIFTSLPHKNKILGTYPPHHLIVQEVSGLTSRLKILSIDGNLLYKSSLLPLNLVIEKAIVHKGYLYVLTDYQLDGSIYNLDLNLENGQWVRMENISKKQLFIQTKEEAIFGDEFKLLLENLTKDGLDFFTKWSPILSSLSPYSRLQVLETDGGLWFITENGFTYAYLSEERSYPITPILEGVSIRQLQFEEDHTLHVSSYEGQFKIKFNHDVAKGTAPEIKSILKHPCPVEYSIQFLKKSNYELVTSGPDFTVFDTVKKTCKVYKIPDWEYAEIWTLYEIYPDQYLVGTTWGIYYINLNELIPSFSKVALTGIVQGQDNVKISKIRPWNEDGKLLISSNTGLLIGDVAKNNPLEIEISKIHLSGQVVLEAEVFAEQWLLIGTSREGAYLIEPESGNAVAHIHEENQLLSNTVHNFLLDDHNALWMASNNGLYRKNLSTGQIQRFGKSDGFLSDEFNRLASAKSETGLVAFGGINGVHIFDPGQLKYKIAKSELPLSGIYLLDYSGRVISEIIPSPDSLIRITYDRRHKSARLLFGSKTLKHEIGLYQRAGNNSTVWVKVPDNEIDLEALQKQSGTFRIQYRLADGSSVCPEFKLHFEFQKSYQAWVLLAMGLLSLLLLYWVLRPSDQPIETDDHVITYEEVGRTYMQAPTKEEKLIDVKGTSDKGTAYTTLLSNKKEYPVLAEDSFDTDQEDLYDESVEIELTEVLDPFAALERELDAKEHAMLLFGEGEPGSFLHILNVEIEHLLANKEFSVGALAQRMNKSTRQFHRNIADATGMTPNKFINYKRVKKGRVLIRDKKKLTISEIAYLIGFSKPSHFSKLFKEQYGISPNEYRSKLDN